MTGGPSEQTNLSEKGLISQKLERLVSVCMCVVCARQVRVVSVQRKRDCVCGDCEAAQNGTAEGKR